MTQHTAAAALLCCAAALGAPTPGHAQSSVVVRPAPAPPRIGGDVEDRARLAQLRGEAPPDGFLLRSTLSRAPAVGGAAPDSAFGDTLVLAPWSPEVLVVNNSDLPFSLNDGALWAGRGTSVSVTGGVRARYHFVRAALAPTYTYAQNADFPLPSDPRVAPPVPAGRSPFSYPWRVYGLSIDYPLRFGAESYQRLDFGQSALYASVGPVEAGFSSENEWWGPAVRNALVMSNNAGGIPRVFVRTARPLATPLGAVEARYSLGHLSTSEFFEPVASTGRSLSAVAVTLRPAAAPTLTVGFARSVFASLHGGLLLTHLLDAVSPIGRPNARPVTDASQRPGRDQVYSLFARWVLPDDGFESYAEWGRTEFPRSLRDLLVAPNHTQGYTLGLQWARPVTRGGTAARVQAEVTNVAQSTTFRQRPTGSWYTSRAVLQGYTQRGQVIGAATGPGSSSQWLATDLLGGAWSAGVFAGRIRWDDDTHYTVNLPNGGFCRHDVSVFGGVRGSARTRVGTVSASVGRANRLNTFFQNTRPCFGGEGVRVDTHNTTVALAFAPIVW